jgi:hypothetical protein
MRSSGGRGMKFHGPKGQIMARKPDDEEENDGTRVIGVGCLSHFQVEQRLGADNWKY